MSGNLSLLQIGSFYELRDQSNELVQTSTDAGVLANAALALYPSGGCSIVFGPGTFNCSQITISHSNTRIEGSGMSTVIQPIGNNSVFYFTSATGGGINYIQVGNFICKDSGLMTGNSAFFYFNAVSGLSYIMNFSLIQRVMFSGTCNRAFYDGGGTGDYLTGQLINDLFFEISSDGATFNNAFLSIMNLRTAIFSHGLLSLNLPNNSPFLALGVGTNSTIAGNNNLENLQVYINSSGYSGTGLILNNINGIRFENVGIIFVAPPNASSTGLSMSGSLGEMVFRRLKIYSANVGILFTSSNDIGFTYLANGSVFEDCGIYRCNTSIKCISDTSTKFFVGGQLLPAGSNFSPNPLTGTVQMFEVQGVDPIGVATITVGTSPFTYTNNDGVREAVYITGGTVTGITKNGVSLGILTTVLLEPGEQISETFTATPNMFRDRKG